VFGSSLVWGVGSVATVSAGSGDVRRVDLPEPPAPAASARAAQQELVSRGLATARAPERVASSGPSPAVVTNDIGGGEVVAGPSVMTPVEVDDEVSPAQRPVLPEPVVGSVGPPVGPPVGGRGGEPGTAPPKPKSDPSKGGGFDPVRSVEVIAERDAFTTTFANPDGTRSVTLSSMPVHFQDAKGVWQQIDNRVVRGENGVLSNEANAWRVRFEVMGPKGGVSFETKEGPFRFWARDAAAVEPVVGDDGASVVYSEVFPGVDLVYRVVGSGVEELLVIKAVDAVSTVTFDVEGLLLSKTSSGLDAVGRGLGELVSISAPETFDAKERPIAVEGQVFESTLSGQGSSVTVGLRPEVLRGMPAESFPVTVDPSVTVGVGASWVHSWAAYTSNGASYASYNDGYARVGNPYLSASSTVRWRSTVFFDYSPYFWASVVDAYLTTTVQSGSGSGARPLYVYSADQDGFHQGMLARQYPLSGPPSASYTMTSTPFSPVPSVSSGTQSHTGTNMWTLYENWARTGTWGGVLLLKGDESAAYTMKKMTISLTLTINRWPANPSSMGSSASGHTLTWWTPAGSDPDGDPIQYNHWIKSNGNLIYQSGWNTSTTQTWTTPPQYRNTTLTFGVDQFDGQCWFAECHVVSTGGQSWYVGNLNPTAPALVSPPNGAALVGSPHSNPTFTFTSAAGSDPEGDPLQYAFFYCTDPNCTTGGNPGLTWLQGWTTPPGGATTYSLTAGLPVTLSGQPNSRWGVAVSDGVGYSFSALRSFSLPNAAPGEPARLSPVSTMVSSLTPTFQIAAGTDADGDPLEYQFRICNTSTWTGSNPGACISSGWTSSLSWSPTSVSSPLRWSTTNFWWVDVRDGWVTVTSNTATPFVPQRTPASHPAIGFGTQPNMRPVAGVNTGNGNLVSTATDLSVPSVVMPLDVVRTYNSGGTAVGGFGPGWTSSWEWSLTNEADGVSFRRPDGSVEFFGRNPGGGYVTSLGFNDTLRAAPLTNPPSVFASAGWSVTTHDNTVHYFSTAGAWLGLRDVAGRIVTLTVAGNTQTVTDTSSGRVIFVDWNATPGASTSRIVGVRTVALAAYGNTPIEWRYYYDASNRLSKACDPRNNAQTGYCYTYAWNTSDRITSILLPRGNTQLAVTYDAGLRVATRTDGLSNTWSYSYSTNVPFTNLAGQQVSAAWRATVTNPDNTQDVYDYDVARRDVHNDNLEGLSEHSTYDVYGWVDLVSEDDTTTTNVLDTFTDDYGYEADSDLISYVDPAGATWTAQYTSAAAPYLATVVVEPSPGTGGSAGPGTVTSTAMDSTRPYLPVQQQSAGQPPETWSYTTGSETVPGQPTQTQPAALEKTHTDTSGVITTSAYNAAGDLASSTTSTGVTTTWTRDEIGRALTETVAWTGGSRTTTFTYTKLGQTATVTEQRVQNPVSGQWHQARTTTVYDANTNPVSVSISDVEPPANGFTPDPTRTSTAEYDNNDRSWRTTDPEGSVTTVEFDVNGNVTKQTDPLGRVTTTTYDHDNRPLVVTAQGYVDPTNPGTPRNVMLSSTTYDDHGRVATETDPLGNVTAYTYDADDRVLTKQLLGYDMRTGGTTNVLVENNTYYPSGDLYIAKTDNDTVVTTYEYDPTSGLPTVTKLGNQQAGYSSLDRYTFTCYTDGRVTGTSTIAATAQPNYSCTTATPLERTTYDSYGRVISTIVENGVTDLVTSYGYDQFGRQTSVTDPNGNVTTTTYDAVGRSSRTTTPLVGVDVYGAATVTTAPYTETGYDTFGGLSHQRDAGGNITSTTFDRNGRPLVTTLPSYTPPGASTPITPTETRAYDAAGNLTAMTNRRGQTTDYVYDIFNRVAITRDPAATSGGTRGEVWNRYDDAGNLVWTRNQEGAVTEHTYDDLGRNRTTVALVRNASPTPYRYTTISDYDWAGNQILEINPAGVTEWTAIYSPAGDELARVDALGNTTISTYDAQSRLLTSAAPQSCETRNVYDIAGRRTSTGCFTGAIRLVGEDTAYDPNGNRTAVTSNRGNTTTFTYNSHSQLTSVVTPTGGTPATITFTYGYDTRDLLTKTIDGRGNTWWTTYNSWGLEESRIEPSTTAHPAVTDRTFTNVYDTAGALVREDKPGGVSVTHTVDLLGRTISDNGGAAGGSRTYTYDKLGRTTAATANSGASTMANTWTDRDQLASVTGTVGWSTFSYDAAGRLVSRGDDAGFEETVYNYDALNRVNALFDPLTYQTHVYGYNQASTLVTDSILYGYSPAANFQRIYTVDQAQRVTNDVTTNTTTNTVLATTSYGYDADSNTITKTVGPAGFPGAGVNSYTYDAAGRLSGWTNPANVTTNYTYDANSNLLANGTTTNTYDERNRQVVSGVTTNTWTARGTLSATITAGTPTPYAFNGLDQLTNVGGVGYVYDPLGRLQSRGTTSFSYSGHHNQPSSSAYGFYVTFTPDDLPVTVLGATGGGHVLTNTHHDVTTVFQPNGAITDTFTYDPWGAVVGRTGTSNIPLGYQSSYTDPTTTNINMGARWYQPNQAHFTNRDTWTGDAVRPVSLNRFIYADASPTVMFDPTGHNACAAG
jgi:RHS repeat-associated protein